MRKNAENSGVIKGPLYYITNQFNLREILSGGFIGNMASFDDKYYEDLLTEANGRIPLFTPPIDRSLIQKVNEHDVETSFPVILEIDSAGVEGEACTVFTGDGSERNSGPVCFAYAGVLSVKSVSAIHFLSIDNLSEFAVRSYSNMPNPRELYKVSPELASDQEHTSNILQRLREVPLTPSPSREDYSSLDRISGAVCLCIHYSNSKEQSKQLLRMLELGRKPKKADAIPYWFNIGLEAKAAEEISSITDINGLVFASTVTVLHTYNLNSVSQKSKILDKIKELIYSHQVSEEHKVILDKSFTKIQKLLKLEEDLEPFKTSAGQDALRGLLLFLLRPRHKELLFWDLSETNASHDAMLTALAYAGIVIGRRGLETEYRPRKVDLEISDMIVSALNRSAEQKSVPGKKTTKSIKLKSAKNEPSATIVQPGAAIPVQLQKTSSIDLAIIRDRFMNGERDSPEVVAAAIRLCKEMGWGDCVKTIVYSSVKEKFLIESEDNGRLTLKLSGFPEILHELDFEHFKMKISKLDLSDIVRQESGSVTA